MKKNHHTQTGFRNIETPSKAHTNRSNYWSFIWRRLTQSTPKLENTDHVLSSNEVLQQIEKHSAHDSCTWLGHDTFLIRAAGLTLLTDPYLTDYASPIKGLFRRYSPPGLTVAMLPKIDVLLVSHNHYDHLDAHTVAQLPNRELIQVIVPLGLGDFFRYYGYKKIIELDWHSCWHTDNLSVTALPAIHFSGRGLFDHNKTLWAGYLLEISGKRIYFAGDTAYGALFSQLGQQYGPIDYGFVPIGAYLPRELLKASHTTPAEAVQMGIDMRINTLIGMHWGTVKLSDEPLFEPPELFLRAGREANYTDEQLWVMKIGETRGLHL
ncbi:MBL fold metallo-hydrolase [soil metagenome]